MPPSPPPLGSAFSPLSGKQHTTSQSRPHQCNQLRRSRRTFTKQWGSKARGSRQGLISPCFGGAGIFTLVQSMLRAMECPGRIHCRKRCYAWHGRAGAGHVLGQMQADAEARRRAACRRRTLVPLPLARMWVGLPQQTGPAPEVAAQAPACLADLADSPGAAPPAMRFKADSKSKADAKPKSAGVAMASPAGLADSSWAGFGLPTGALPASSQSSAPTVRVLEETSASMLWPSC